MSAPLVADHDVQILDQRLDKDLRSALEDFSPDIVDITAYAVRVNTVKKLFQEIKDWNRRVLTVVEGRHATDVPEDFRTPSIDLIVTGEGVFPFREIVRRFEGAKGFDGIPSVAFVRDSQLV